MLMQKSIKSIIIADIMDFDTNKQFDFVLLFGDAIF